MRVTMYWHGGSSYAAPDSNNPSDGENFDSLAEAKRAFERRGRDQDRYYPCVDECPADDGGPSAWVFKREGEYAACGEYPDYVIEFGRRGGVTVGRA